uniref:CEP170 C-terminal domain-containing protein n=1 Tax=Poecilia mexicana TaxID=48701 RepID=A0A3B3YK30_9TELE
PAGLTSVKQNSRDQDEYMRDWTAHSEEIARSKDLAMLAREIHDVAGEIDSVSPAATDPGALVQTHHMSINTLEESVFDDGLDLGGSTAEQSRIPAGEGRTVELRQRSSNNQSSRSIRRQTWNRDDLYLDNVLLASVTQLSTRIRQSVDKTTCKVRILFKDKERKWDEIETKLQAEHDSLLPYENYFMHSISGEFDAKRCRGYVAWLFRSVIDMMVDPDGTLDALSSMGLTSPLSDQRTSPGSQQGAQALHSRTETKTSSTPSAPRHEELSGEPCGSSERTEETKQGKSVASEN